MQGIKDKLESDFVYNFLQNNTFVLLSETKTADVPSLSGFTAINNPAKQSYRGGVAVLVKNCIFKNIVKINKSYENMISFQLDYLPCVIFILCYITPDDSPYYDKAIFGQLHSIVNENKDNVYILFGDLNARIGTPDLTSISAKLSYPSCEDIVTNHNGRLLLNMCKDTDMVIVNNLQIERNTFKSQLSYRKGKKWISELDYCLISLKGLKYVKQLRMIQSVQESKLPSDHAMLQIDFNFDEYTQPYSIIEDRAKKLDKSVYDRDEEIVIKKTLNMSNVDKGKVREYLQNHLPPNIQDCDEERMTVIFFEEAERAMKLSRIRKEENRLPLISNRWRRIFTCNDNRLIWKSIGWNGEIVEHSDLTPTDNEFKQHFEELLNPDKNKNRDTENNAVYSNTYIPLLDDMIDPNETIDAIKCTSSNKAYIGVDAGFLKLLPRNWILVITNIFNRIFFGNYPYSWCFSKLIILFKKGSRYLCGNYRGITITDTLAKLYDKVLFNRLKLWFSVDKCQAGSQEGRGCIEQILALRLLSDYAKCNRKKLFICFIDFSKAYDRISRPILFEILTKLGCGHIMLRSLQAIYKTTKNVFNSAVIDAKKGIKQGGSSSGLLFILYMDILSKMIGNVCQEDGYLGSLHSLMLMDDTAILATSRETLLKRYDALIRFCKEYEMVINDDKTKLMVINGTTDDKKSFSKGGLTIKHTDSYVYLGSPFSAKGNMTAELKEHADMKQKQVNKFSIFCSKNQSMPFLYKKKVFDAVLTTKIIYACESWLTDNLKPIETMYMNALKSLLGVRKQTPNEIVLMECGVPDVKDLVQGYQQKFILKKLKDPEEPLTKVFNLCQSSKTKGFLILQKVTNTADDSLNSRKDRFNRNNGTKYNTYKMINPSLSVHEVYTNNSKYLPDYKRVELTRFRTGSHKLMIEKGRWSRTPREDRFCPCDNKSIQDEPHVIFECRETAEIRAKYNLDTSKSLNEVLSDYANVNFIFDVMKIFK